MISDQEEGLTVHNDKHLEWAFRQLSLMEMGLASLRTELAQKNPALLVAASPAYERRIATLQQEIATYLYRNPPAISVALKNYDMKMVQVTVPFVAAKELIPA